MTCPEYEVLREYHEDLIEAPAIGEHIEVCRRCASVLKAIESDSMAWRRAFADWRLARHVDPILFGDWIDGGLSLERIREVEDHLSKCYGCREEGKELRALVRNSLGALKTPIPAGATRSSNSVLGKILQRLKPRPEWVPRLAWGFIGMVFITLTGILGHNLYLRKDIVAKVNPPVQIETQIEPPLNSNVYGQKGTKEISTAGDVSGHYFNEGLPSAKFNLAVSRPQNTNINNKIAQTTELNPNSMFYTECNSSFKNRSKPCLLK